MTAAALDALTGDTEDAHAAGNRRRGSAHRPRRRPHRQALESVFVAAALAARRDDIETAAVLLAAAARHADPLGIGGHALMHACRVHAQTAVDAYPGDLTAARRRGEAMTLDDLITYTLDTLT